MRRFCSGLVLFGGVRGLGRSDHSWYASWAPSDHPKLVVVVMIEHGGFGADAAAPAAKQIYEAYFHTKP